MPKPMFTTFESVRPLSLLEAENRLTTPLSVACLTASFSVPVCPTATLPRFQV